MARRSLLCIAVGLAAFWPAVGRAQIRIVPGNGNAPQLFQNFFGGGLPTTIAGGRVVVTNRWQYGTFNSSSDDGTAKEEIRCQGFGATGSLHYERTTPAEQLSLDLSADGRFALRHSNKDKAKGPMVELTQAPGAPITLSVGEGPQQTVYRQPTLWHLFMLEPEVCGKHLLPLLQPFPWHAQLTQTTVLLEPELLRLAAAGKIPSGDHWPKLVRQLADDDFSRREAADRALRVSGAVVAGYLEQLDHATLDAEQQFRIERILESLHGQTATDTTEQVAVQLAADPLVWLALLARPELATRQAAAKALAALLGEPVAVDPAADPATQKDRREQLRARLQRPKVAAKPAAKP
jgi:hypothetical protein